MRKVLPLAAILYVSPLVLHSQAVPVLTAGVRDTTITVSITRTGRAPADRASLYLGVEAIAESPALAVERMQAKMKAVLDSVKRVSPTTSVEVPVVFGASPAQQATYPQPIPQLSVARGAVRIVLSKLSELPAIQAATTAAGSTMSGGLSYESTSADAIWKMKSAEALSAAKATAELSAEIQGYKLGRLLTMNVSGGPQNLGFASQMQLNFDSRNSYINTPAPEAPVNASVTVTYLLVKK